MLLGKFEFNNRIRVQRDLIRFVNSSRTWREGLTGLSVLAIERFASEIRYRKIANFCRRCW